MPENGLKVRSKSRLKGITTFASLMNQQKFISPNIFVFSKWSRKEYAIFASLGKLIKIGVLKADICQKALLKGIVDLGIFTKIKEDPDEDDRGLNIEDPDFFQLILSSLGLSIFQAQILISLKTFKKGNPFRTILFNGYKVCFLQSKKQTFLFSIKR